MWFVPVMQVIYTELQEAKNRHYHICKVSGTNKLIQTAFVLDKEVLSPL